MSPHRALLATLAALPLAACPGFGDREIESALGNTDAGTPTCEQVMQVLETRCNQCHSVPATEGAPTYLRLDTFEDVDGVVGAHNQAARIVARASDGTMPPGGVIFEEEVAVLQQWLDEGATYAACVPGDGVPDSGMPDAGSDAATADDVALGDTRTTAATLEAVANVFQNTCAPHHYGASATIIDLTNDGSLLDRLLAPATQQPDLDLVVPGDPDGSYLVMKVEGRHLDNGGSGGRMPVSGTLSDDDLALIRAWIEDLDPPRR